MEIPLPDPVPAYLAPSIDLAVLKARRRFPGERRDVERIKSALFAIAKILLKATRGGEMRVEQALESLEEFLQLLCVHDSSLGPLYSYDLDHDFGFDTFAKLKAEIKQSKEWINYLRKLEALGRARNKGPETLAEGRRATIDAFIWNVKQATGRSVKRRDIWTVAGYTNSTDFERFQRGDTRATKASTAAFERVLKMEPDAFVRSSDKKASAR